MLQPILKSFSIYFILLPFIIGSVGSMPLQFLEIGSHVENHAIEWRDFERDTQFHEVVMT